MEQDIFELLWLER